ncbi:unnamed protein product, partial [Staurois parvus]
MSGSARVLEWSVRPCTEQQACEIVKVSLFVVNILKINK